MNLNEEYDDRDALLRALDSNILETKGEDGATRFRWNDPERAAMKRKLDLAARDVERERNRRAQLESALADSERERRRDADELERLRATSGAEPDAAKRWMDQATAARAKAAALEAQLEPLRAQLQRFKEREERAAVESQLVDAARKLNCCESALRDVKRLAPLFKLNDEGVALSEDAKLVSEVLQEEIALSPHWLKRSQGGDAEPGELPAPRAADDARFRDALADPDVPFADLLRLAPRLDRARPF